MRATINIPGLQHSAFLLEISLPGKRTNSWTPSSFGLLGVSSLSRDVSSRLVLDNQSYAIIFEGSYLSNFLCMLSSTVSLLFLIIESLLSSTVPFLTLFKIFVIVDFPKRFTCFFLLHYISRYVYYATLYLNNCVVNLV